jgi:hypothetical protein
VLYKPANFTEAWYELITADESAVKCIPLKASLDQSPGGTAVTGISSEDGQPIVEGGTCSVPSSGACAPANLTAFGDAASQAGQVCFGESSGVAGAESGTDRMPDGRAVSYGLFQINISANRVNGLNCPSAFDKAYTSKVHDVHVTNEALFSQCKEAAKNPAINIADAAALYQRYGWRIWGAAHRCGLALSDTFPYIAYSCNTTTYL